jgi:multidrug/hemolysin transport system ATP-binding protein
MIAIEKLKKSYGLLDAVKNISFQVGRGSFFAFLGPNGAGKSTTINILCTLLEKNSGNIKIGKYELGKEDDHIRKLIGVVFQQFMLDRKLTIRQNLMIRGSFYHLSKDEIQKRIHNLQILLNIDYLDQAYGKLSGGQKRRADIARALIHEPQILILDEPTTGLDPKTRKDVWEVIDTLRKKKMTIFLTTHYMEEAANADKIVIINKGEIVAEGSPDQLKKTYAKDTLRLAGNIDAMINYCVENGLIFEQKNDVIYIETSSLHAINIIQDLKEMMTGFEMIQATLDDVFLDIINKGDEDERHL